MARVLDDAQHMAASSVNSVNQIGYRYLLTHFTWKMAVKIVYNCTLCVHICVMC